jgi:phenylacetate-CoA ligase
MGWQGRVGDAVKVRGMFLHPRQLREVMANFPQVTRWQAVITRREHKDYLTLRVVCQPDADISAIASVAHEAVKLQLEVKSAPEESISPDAPPIRDERTWE